MALTFDKSIPKLKAINSSLDRMLVENINQSTTLRDIAHSIEFEGITVSFIVIKQYLSSKLFFLGV